jgi:hypothetical protein
MIPSRGQENEEAENLSLRTIQVLYLPPNGIDAPIRLQSL